MDGWTQCWLVWLQADHVHKNTNAARPLHITTLTSLCVYLFCNSSHFHFQNSQQDLNDLRGFDYFTIMFRVDLKRGLDDLANPIKLSFENYSVYLAIYWTLPQGTWMDTHHTNKSRSIFHT